MLFDDVPAREAILRLHQIEELIKDLPEDLKSTILATALYNEAERQKMPMSKFLPWFVDSTLTLAEQEGKI